jgi:hypothetical protein
MSGTKPSKKQKTRVYVDLKAMEKMKLWAALAGKRGYEFTCFARTIIDEETGCPHVLDAYLVKHEGDSGSVEADDEDVIKTMMKLNSEGIPPDEAFRCWVHSHPGTGPSATYLSSTDEANIDRIMTGDWLVSIVLDSKGENPYCRIDTASPMRLRHEAELIVLEPPIFTKEELEGLKAIFEEKSSKKKYQYQGYQGSRSGSVYQGRGSGSGQAPPRYPGASQGQGRSWGHGYGGGFGSGYQGGYYGSGQGSTYVPQSQKAGTSSGSSANGYRGNASSASSSASSSSSSASSGTGRAPSTVKETELSKEDEELLREHLAAAFDLDDSDIQDQWIAYARKNLPEVLAWKEAFSMDQSYYAAVEDDDEGDDSVLKAGDSIVVRKGAIVRSESRDSKTLATLKVDYPAIVTAVVDNDVRFEDAEDATWWADIEDLDMYEDIDEEEEVEETEASTQELQPGDVDEEGNVVSAHEETDVIADVIEEAFSGDGDGVPLGFEVVSEAELLFELDEDEVIVGDAEAQDKSDDEGVPDYDPAVRMGTYAVSQDLDRIAKMVMDAKISAEDAVAMAMQRHQLREAEAQTELAKRI